MEGNNKEEEKSNQQPEENKEEKVIQNDENMEVKKKENINQEKKELKQTKKNELEKKIKEKIFIYFIGNHNENIPFDFELDKSEIASDLEILSEGNFPVNNINYKYSIYRLKYQILNQKIR